MRSKTFLNIACLLCLSFVFGQQTFAQKNDDPTLRQDLDDLKKALSFYGSIQNPDNERLTYRLTPIKFKGCEVKYAYQEIDAGSSTAPITVRNPAVLADSRNDLFLSPTYRSVIELDFSRLDVASIKLSPGTPTKLVFHAQDSKNAIRERTPTAAKKLNEAWIPLRVEEKAEEILTLFTNVARGCQTAAD